MDISTLIFNMIKLTLVNPYRKLISEYLKFACLNSDRPLEIYNVNWMKTVRKLCKAHSRLHMRSHSTQNDALIAIMLTEEIISVKYGLASSALRFRRDGLGTNQLHINDYRSSNPSWKSLESINSMIQFREVSKVISLDKLASNVNRLFRIYLIYMYVHLFFFTIREY
jgi:hypothetical protein